MTQVTERSIDAQLPDEALSQLDALYVGLKGASNLLAQGRSFGIVVGLSAPAMDAIRARHGEEAEAVLSNIRII